MNRYHFGTIRRFETENFTVSIDAFEDDHTDLSFDDTGEIRRKLQSGDLIAFKVECKVIHKPTGTELGADYLGRCIYESIEAFQDHRECGKATRRRIRREGRFQIYRENRPFKQCLSRSDKLRKRGFATRERAEAWAYANVTEPYEIFESGTCGSYFADMIHSAIAEARREVSKLTEIKLRKV